MTIKVPGQATSTVGLAGYTRPAAAANADDKASRDTAAPAATPVGTDTVNVTAEARALNHISSVASSQPVVDLHRVESLRKDIERGAYNTDPYRVAMKLFSFERALSA